MSSGFHGFTGPYPMLFPTSPTLSIACAQVNADRKLIPLLKRAGRTVVAFPIREYWLDVGRHHDLDRAAHDIASGLLD